METVHIRLKGDFYTMDTHCTTLKEAIETLLIKRGDIAEWWKQ